MVGATGMVSTSTEVAAHPIDVKASAKVASREAVWRRRNWLRLACTRNQSCTAVDETVGIATPSAVIAACPGEANASAATSGANITPMVINTTSILARVTRDGVSGAVATRSAASSPHIVKHARPPGRFPADI